MSRVVLAGLFKYHFEYGQNGPLCVIGAQLSQSWVQPCCAHQQKLAHMTFMTYLRHRQVPYDNFRPKSATPRELRMSWEG